jgi:hypothetical protein
VPPRCPYVRSWRGGQASAAALSPPVDPLDGPRARVGAFFEYVQSRRGDPRFCRGERSADADLQVQEGVPTDYRPHGSHSDIRMGGISA